MASDWRSELVDLLAAYIGQQGIDRGVEEMVHVTARHRDYHERYLGAIDAGIKAAERKDQGLLDQLSKALGPIDSYEEAVDFLSRLKTAYLQRYRAATQNGSKSKPTS